MGRLLLLVSLWLALPAWGGDDGRYQALVVGAESAGPAGSNGGRIFILDTREGHFWSWIDSDVVQGRNGRLRVGSVLRYQGQLQVGEKPGQVIIGGAER